MARFQDLSLDLLYIIFSHLQDDKTLLRSFSLSFRFLCDVSQRFLVRNVTISHSPSFSRSELFLRTIQERPDLVAHVHRLEIDLLREHTLWPDEANTIRLIARLLTNLREFSYMSRDYKIWHFELPFPLAWNSEHAHDQVRRIEWDHNMTMRTLHECMELPRIASIYCRELVKSFSDAPETFNLPTGSSSVKELNLGFDDEDSLPPLRLVLQMPHCLQKLSLNLHHTTGTGADLEDTIWHLEPVQNTLQELVISSSRSYGRPDVAHTAADLSKFTQLRKLKVPLRYMVGHDFGKSGGTSAILPPQLKELTITFFSTTAPLVRRAGWIFTTLMIWLERLSLQQERSKNLTLLRIQDVGFTKYHGDIDLCCYEDILRILNKIQDQRGGAFVLTPLSLT